MSDMSRRELVARATILGGALALSGPEALAKAPKKKHKRKLKEGLASEGAFTLGVASGFPTPTGAVLWTRVDGLEQSQKLNLEVATDRDFKNVVQKTLVRAPAVRDYTARHQVSGLTPGAEYFYRFETRHSSSPVGRLRTLRPPDSRQPVKIGVFSCQSYEAGYYTALAGLAAEDDLDLVLCLGDYIYEHHYYDGPAERKDTTGPNKDGDVQTLDEYRAKYRLYKSDPNLQAVHAQFPIVPIWDDHEVEDNYAGENADTESTDPTRTENDNKTLRRVPIGERRRVGYLAHFEYLPRIRAKPVDDKIYGKVPLGANASLFLTDERQYRSGQPCGDQLAVPCGDDANPANTMLGKEQLSWFQNSLASDGATWKLWANEVMVMALDSAPGVALNPDQWDGYAYERGQLLGFVKDKGLQNFVALTGDIHTFFAGNVTTDGRDTGQPVGTEFVGGSISSLGLSETFGPATAAVQAGATTNNLHIKYANLTDRGYMVVTAAQDKLDVKYRSPASILTPTSTVRDLAHFQVIAGTPAVQTV